MKGVDTNNAEIRKAKAMCVLMVIWVLGWEKSRTFLQNIDDDFLVNH